MMSDTVWMRQRILWYIPPKRIPYYDMEKDVVVHPKTPNGIKLEYFVFDSFLFANSVAVVLCDREEEFAPIKSLTGKDSLESARAMMSKLHWKWMKNAGAKLAENVAEESVICEVFPEISYQGENLKELCQGKQYQSLIGIGIESCHARDGFESLGE
eukprot:GHVO01047517.1.p1 GENE.GHVO01047517.1~~GHVO01047517.1.p1  ORF type:complete len:157 (-),score=20.27 GHVO01047517.1:129-599(-)